MDGLAERVLDLEEKLAYQDHLLNELNQLAKQTADAVVFLRSELRVMKDGASTEASPIERPPHY